MKSLKQKLGVLPFLSSCCRRWLSVMNTSPFSLVNSMSSLTLLAGKIPTTALACNNFSSITFLNMALASSNKADADSPTTLSVKISGNLPANSQVLKNGTQSIN